MSDEQDYRIKVSLDPTSATAGGDAIIAKQAQIKQQLEQATAVAQLYGVSIETAQAALAQLRTEQAQAEVLALRQAMEEASADATKQQGTAEENAERMQQLLREQQQGLLRNAFYVHRLAEGFKDLGQGGRMAGQGLLDISESLQYMLPPSAAIYIVMAQVAGVLAAMAFRHREAAGEARAHADAEKSAAQQIEDAWKPMNDMLDESLKDLKENKVFSTLAGQAKEFTSELEIQQNVLKTIQTALDRLEDAKFGAQEALLNREEQESLKGKTGEDAEAIRLEYDKKLEDLRAAHEVDKADRAVAAKQAELLDLQKQADSVKAQKAAALADVQRSHDSTSAGATGASLGQSDWEFVRDEIQRLKEQQRAAAAGEADRDGNAIQPLTAAESAKLIADQYIEPQLHQEQVQKGPQYKQGLDRLKDQRKALEEQAANEAAEAESATYETYPGGPSQTDLRQKAFDSVNAKFAQQAAQIDAQIDAFSKTQNGYDATSKALDTATKTITDTDKKLEEIQGKAQATQIELDAAKINAQAAREKGGAETQKAANAQDAFDQKTQRETRDLQLKAEIDAAEKEIKDDTGNPDAVAAAQRKLDELKAQQVRNETADKQQGETLEPGLSAATAAEGAARAGNAGDSTKTDEAAARADQAKSDKDAETALRSIQDAASGHRDVGAKTQELTQLLALYATEQGKVNAATLEHINRAMEKVKAEIDAANQKIDAHTVAAKNNHL